MVGTDVALPQLQHSIPGGEVIKQGCFKLEVISMDTVIDSWSFIFELFWFSNLRLNFFGVCV